ncbi:MAG: hypothetical protein JRJ62_15625 [Deltaproteobacteria bacterium]|nr:hypothetical protein [Deltaproteobacteria bacterium]
MAKYKRTNLGTKDRYDTIAKQPKNKISYPSFSKIKLVGLDQNTSENRDDLNYNFEIINIEF